MVFSVMLAIVIKLDFNTATLKFFLNRNYLVLTKHFKYKNRYWSY